MPAMIADEASLEELFDNPAAEIELQYRYLDRNRRIPVGPSVNFVFENSRTLAFRRREVESLRRKLPPDAFRRMRSWYESLLPTADRLCAEVSVRKRGARPTSGMSHLADSIAKGEIRMEIGGLCIPGEILPNRAGDRVLGPAFWVTFRFDDASRTAMQEFAVPAFIVIESGEYNWTSDPISYEVRRSLCGDLIE